MDFVNGLSEQQETYCKDKAKEMVSLFMAVSDEEGLLDDNGFEDMKEMFDQVPDPFKGYAFLNFLDELDRQNIVYDIDSFHDTEEDTMVVN